MNSVGYYFAKCIMPVCPETMSRIDYFLFIILYTALWCLLVAALGVADAPERIANQILLNQGWLYVLALKWMWLCATLNRAADTGVTRWTFAKYYFLGPILAALLCVFVPVLLGLLLLVASVALPTLFLFFWPGRPY